MNVHEKSEMETNIYVFIILCLYTYYMYIYMNIYMYIYSENVKFIVVNLREDDVKINFYQHFFQID